MSHERRGASLVSFRRGRATAGPGWAPGPCVRASARPDRVGSTAYGRRCLGVGPSAPSVAVRCAAPFPRARGRPRGDLARPVFWIAGGGTVAIRDGGTPPAPIAEDFGWRRRSCSAASLQETDTDGAGRWRTVSEGCWVKFCLCRYRNGSIRPRLVTKNFHPKFFTSHLNTCVKH